MGQSPQDDLKGEAEAIAGNPYVFVSYSHSDRDYATKIARMLESCEVGYFLDSKDLDWGGDIEEKVAAALARSSHLLIILSPASVKSLWVGYEVGHAKSLSKTILPFLTHPDLQVPTFLSRLNYLTDIKSGESFFKTLGQDKKSSRSRTPGKVDTKTRDAIREERNRSLIAALKQEVGITDCSVLQLEDHSDKGYLLHVRFDDGETSAAEVLSTVRETIGKLFPDLPYWGELNFENGDSIGFAFTYIDEYNKFFK